MNLKKIFIIKRCFIFDFKKDTYNNLYEIPILLNAFKILTTIDDKHILTNDKKNY